MRKRFLGDDAQAGLLDDGVDGAGQVARGGVRLMIEKVRSIAMTSVILGNVFSGGLPLYNGAAASGKLACQPSAVRFRYAKRSANHGRIVAASAAIEPIFGGGARQTGRDAASAARATDTRRPACIADRFGLIVPRLCPPQR